MHKRIFGSIRTRLMIAVIGFTLFLLICIFAIMMYIFSSQQRSYTIQRTEFNLQLVGALIDEDLASLQSLSLWSAISSDITPYLRQEEPTAKDSVLAYERLANEVQASRANKFVRRLALYTSDGKLLQTGNATSSDVPIVMHYMRSALEELIASSGESTYIGNDFLSRAQTQTLIFLRSVSLPNNTGVSYISASTQVFLNPLMGLTVSNKEHVYLTTISGDFLINDSQLIETNALSAKTQIEEKTLHSQTQCFKFKNENGEAYLAVRYPLETLDGWYLTHTMPETIFFALSADYLVLLLLICILVVLFGVAIAYYLHRTINKPVARLCNRIQCVAGGDFSKDNTIEWDNELGDIGRGINSLSKDVSNLMDTRLKNEKQKRKLEYQMLQNQINPHFIYNTLNSIKWMATLQNATGIAEMITAFSRLLKSVAKGNEELIPLREEFALLNDYCVIQQYRYGGSITLEIAEISDEALCECLIPRFTLQPLAENAIFHGIEPKGGLGSIWLTIGQEENGDICIYMQDDGVGMSEETIRKVFNGKQSQSEQKYKQIGILNVHRRIQFEFGEKYGISIQSVVGEYTRMKITLPHITIKE